MTYLSDLAAGLAGEHLTCADLLEQGYMPMRTEQTAPYDIAVDLGPGAGIVRLQVKAARTSQPFKQQAQTHVTGYTWGLRHGKGANRAYEEGLVDAFALVALDIKRVAYVRTNRQIMQLPTLGNRRDSIHSFEQYTWPNVLEQMGIAA